MILVFFFILSLHAGNSVFRLVQHLTSFKTALLFGKFLIYTDFLDKSVSYARYSQIIHEYGNSTTQHIPHMDSTKNCLIKMFGKMLKK